MVVNRDEFETVSPGIYKGHPQMPSMTFVLSETGVVVWTAVFAEVGKFCLTDEAVAHFASMFGLDIATLKVAVAFEAGVRAAEEMER